MDSLLKMIIFGPDIVSIWLETHYFYLSNDILPFPFLSAAVLRSISVDVTAINTEHVTAINTAELIGPNATLIVIELSLELLNLFAEEDELLKVTSSVHMSVTELFPYGLSTRNE